MNEKLHQPVYSAAIDQARADLREIGELIDQLRARQEQIYAAVEALELVVGSPAEAARPAAKPVYDISAKIPQSAQNSQRQAEPKAQNTIEQHVNDALRAKALA
jgi:hypothetical protein